MILLFWSTLLVDLWLTRTTIEEGTDISEIKSVTEQDDKYTDIPLPLNAIASPSFLPSITALSSSCLSTLLLHGGIGSASHPKRADTVSVVG